MKRNFLLAALLALVTLPAHAAPRVAVFAQAGFPAFMVSPLASPGRIAVDLKLAGLEADLLDANALADPQRFNAQTYAALVLPYGNAYPQAAFANMRAFHRAGGCLVLSGIPFTHAVARASAAGWDGHPDWGTNARVVGQAHSGVKALELSGLAGDWAGVNTARLPVHGGDSVQVSGWVKDVSGTAGGDDWLYIRFFDAADHFIVQRGPQLTTGDEWRQIMATLRAPATAATMDISPQVRGAKRVLALDDIALSINGRPVNLPNAGFETMGNDWADLGHNSSPALFGRNGIGVGGFIDTPLDSAPVVISPNDPLHLQPLRADMPRLMSIQTLDTTSLPDGTTVLPALSDGVHITSALIVHHDTMFPGAVDVWTYHPAAGDRDSYVLEQFLARGVVAALAAKGALPPAVRQTAFAALDRAPHPKAYVNLVLPTPRRPYPTFQPKLPPPARHLYLADIRKLGHAERLLLMSLQGIVNRKQPRIYLLTNDEDAPWLTEMQHQGDTGTTIPVAAPLSLVRTFRASINGAVVADPKVYMSPSVAASVAGADDLVIATPALAASLHLPIKVDLRGKFKDDADALRYVRTTLWPRLNPYLAICLDPPILDSGAIDQIIAMRGAAFWITGPKAQNQPGANTAAELDEVRALLAQMPLNAVVRGFWWHGNGFGLDEGAGVSMGSRFGKVTVVSDYVSNLSVFSGVPAAGLKQKPRAPAPPLDRSKVYIALTMSDGDNLSTWRAYFRNYFHDPLHGTIPIGWGMGPSIIDNAPTWARWYYEHAAPNDEFICDVSGVGYMYPPDFGTALRDRDAALRAFYGLTQTYMERMDMHTMRLMGVSATDIAQAGPDMPRVPFLMPDYGWSGERSYDQFTYTLPTGQPVFRAITNAVGGAATLAEQVRSRVGTARPAFANVFIWNWGSKLSDVKKMLALLGPDYVPVLPSQLNELYWQAHPAGELRGASP